MDPSGLEQDGFKFASSAVELDQKGLYLEAIFYYKEAAEALRHAAVAGSKIDAATKADEYMRRVEELAKHLQTLKKGAQVNAYPKPPQVCQGEQRAKFLVKQALDEDEQGNSSEALELYAQAVELCIKTRDIQGISQASKKQLEELAKLALSRGEEIKARDMEKKLAALPQIVNDLPVKDPKTSVNSTTRAKPRSPLPPKKPLGTDFNLNEDQANQKRPNPSHLTGPPSRPTPSGPSAGGLTKQEIAVLRATSFINGREYVPFMSVDLKERFAFPVPFTDKSGLLELSEKQKKRLKAWMRPSEFAEEPQMIMAVSSFSIKQTVVSDCSFVASLAISAAYERRFRKKLITR